MAGSEKLFVSHAPISEVQEWKHFLPVLGGTVTSEC